MAVPAFATILGQSSFGARRLEACREKEREEREEQGGRSPALMLLHPGAAADAPGSASVSPSVNRGCFEVSVMKNTGCAQGRGVNPAILFLFLAVL